MKNSTVFLDRYAAISRRKLLAVISIGVMVSVMLLSRGGYARADDEVKAMPPEVTAWVARDVAPGPKVRLTLNTRNVEKVNLAAYRLQGSEWLLRRDHQPTMPVITSAPVRRWTADMRPPREKKQAYQIDKYRSRQINLPPFAPGIYLIVVQGGGQQAWAVVNITNLAIVAKRSPKRLLAWVTDFRTGAPVAGAYVALRERSGDTVAAGRVPARGRTGQDGAVLFAAPPGENQVLIVSRGGDNAGVPLAVQNPDGTLKMHFQTDRPVYRPGQRVYYKAILRRTAGRGWRPVQNTTCSVQVRDARDVVLAEEKLKTNELGTLAGQVDLLEEGALGQYSIVISIDGYDPQYAAFTVAAYRKPEYQVAITPGAKRYLAGEKVTFDLKANYYFGAPVPNATVRYIVRRADLPFYFHGEDDGSGYWYGGDGNLYPRDTYAQNDVVADGTADLDEKGQVTITVPSLNTGGDATYSVSATVTDGSRRQVEAAAGVPVYRAAKRLSVQGEVSYVPVGFLMPLRLRAIDLDGKPTGGHVTLVLKKPEWNKKEGRYRYVEVTRTSVQIPSNGMAKATLPAQAEGDLRVEATMPDGTGRTAFATWGFWVAGPMTSWQREDAEPTLTLKPDKRLYRPGETAKILVATNVLDRPVLAVLEGLDIWGYKVIPAGKRNFSWSIPARLEMSPNAYVGAVQWAKHGLISDNAVLPIPDPSRQLNVTIKSDRQEYRPGDKAHYTLQTTDDKGKGIGAEVAVSVVDEALYAVRPDNTPDLYKLFWALRENFVTMATSAPEELSGGAYQRVNKMASVRQQFLDTAFWSARLRTDSTGKASFDVQVPGNLTTWRATARAITGDTRVGTATQSVTATRPVTLRLATPRQFVQGDELTLIGSVNNRTKQQRTFETAISASGLEIGGEKVQQVAAAPRGEGRVQWPLTVATLPPSGEVKIKGRTLATDAAPDQGEELSDAVETSVKVVPNGVLQHRLDGGTLEQERDLTVPLPDDQIAGTTSGVLSIRGGVGQVAASLGTGILSNQRYASPVAAARLLVAALSSRLAQPDEARENIALLSRYQTGQGGWGWWEDGNPDALNTATALSALARARSRGVQVPLLLMERGVSGAQALYNGTQLWEHRALLAAAITLADRGRGNKLLDEVQRRAENLSPYARLTLAEALLEADRRAEAKELARAVLKEVVESPDTAYLRVGVRPGWSANGVDATAAALSLLLQLGEDRDMQAKMARWLVEPGNGGYYSLETTATRYRALWKYDQAHPAATQRGKVTVTLNGENVEVPSVSEERPLEIALPRSLWKDGENRLRIRRDGEGEVFYALDTRIYRPATLEDQNGVRVFRRYDVQNEAKAWDELKRAVRPGEPVRCTVVVWPGERADAMRIIEPLPAGFEYVESDARYGNPGISEVRDGAVVHYVRGNGLPLTFRYYMRAESEGHVTALPATAEVLRRPTERGNSSSLRLEVKQ